MIQTVPWWLVALLILGLWVAYLVTTNTTYGEIFATLREGAVTTLRVSFFAYVFAMIIGLSVGLARVNPPSAKSGFGKLVVYNVATLYLEVLRGLPILVVLLIIAFVAVPSLIDTLTSLGFTITVRDVSIELRAIIALSLAYGAFLSEIFRAGIQSIERGQLEAGRSLGMTYIQVMQLIILPQAIRRILPPLGNDFISMIKDSALVAILAVRDITQLAKLSSGQSFLYLETYLLAAMIYLSMTVMGSLLVRWIEYRLRIEQR
ncbi:MAG: amino acid ABC transporter permease [Burkholderiales bacterium]|nr:amino acid ABC transporter permease [Anaerolineae bacterium]